MPILTGEMKVGEIARIWPETMKVFARYKLDLCCGGVYPLEVAAKKHGFDVDRLLKELHAVIGSNAVQTE